MLLVTSQTSNDAINGDDRNKEREGAGERERDGATKNRSLSTLERIYVYGRRKKKELTVIQVN